MPATSEEKQRESRASAVTASLTLACGIYLMYVSFNGWHSPAVAVVDHLTKFASVGGDTLTTKRIMQSLFAMSLLVIGAAIVGIAGALMRHKGPVCTYVIVASALSLVVLTSSAQTTQRRWLAGPLIMSEVDDLCNASTYIRLSSSLGCDFARGYDAAEVTPCDATCKYRVSQLRDNDGCQVLPALCSSFTYEHLEGGGCLAAAMNTGLTAYRHIGAPLSADECHKACDMDIGCDTFIVLRREASNLNNRTQCIVLSVSTSYHDPANWTKMPDKWRQTMRKGGVAALMKSTGNQLQSGELVEAVQSDDAGGMAHQCFRRKEPQVLVEFLEIGLYLSVATTAVGIFLSLSMFCTCCILYNVNMSRRGLPTAIDLGLMMLCPCCSQHIHRKFNEDFFEHFGSFRRQPDSADEDESSGSDGYSK